MLKKSIVFSALFIASFAYPSYKDFEEIDPRVYNGSNADILEFPSIVC
jgi:hypothetical protein